MSVEEEAAIKKEAEASLTISLSLMNEVEIKKEEEASEDVCKKSEETLFVSLGVAKVEIKTETESIKQEIVDPLDAGGGDEEGIGVQDVEGLVESLMEGEEVEEVEYVEREEGMEQVTGLEGLEGLKEKFEGVITAEGLSQMNQHNKEEYLGLVSLKCVLCEHEARNITQFRSHRATAHPRHMAYSCELCDFSSKTPKQLIRHEKKFHAGTKYRCKECDYSDCSSVFVGIHMKTFHFVPKKRHEDSGYSNDPCSGRIPLYSAPVINILPADLTNIPLMQTKEQKKQEYKIRMSEMKEKTNDFQIEKITNEIREEQKTQQIYLEELEKDWIGEVQPRHVLTEEQKKNQPNLDEWMEKVPTEEPKTENLMKEQKTRQKGLEQRADTINEDLKAKIIEVELKTKDLTPEEQKTRQLYLEQRALKINEELRKSKLIEEQMAKHLTLAQKAKSLAEEQRTKIPYMEQLMAKQPLSIHDQLLEKARKIKQPLSIHDQLLEKARRIELLKEKSDEEKKNKLNLERIYNWNEYERNLLRGNQSKINLEKEDPQLYKINLEKAKEDPQLYRINLEKAWKEDPKLLYKINLEKAWKEDPQLYKINLEKAKEDPKLYKINLEKAKEDPTYKRHMECIKRRQQKSQQMLNDQIDLKGEKELLQDKQENLSNEDIVIPSSCIIPSSFNSSLTSTTNSSSSVPSQVVNNVADPKPDGRMQQIPDSAASPSLVLNSTASTASPLRLLKPTTSSRLTFAPLLARGGRSGADEESTGVQEIVQTDSAVNSVHQSIEIPKKKAAVFGCDLCVKFFDSQAILRLHYRKGNHGFKCEICDFVSPSPSGIIKHSRSTSHGVLRLSVKSSFVNQGVSYICEQCKYPADTIGLLKAHNKSAHGVTHKCDLCPYVITTTSRNLQLHKESKHSDDGGIKLDLDNLPILNPEDPIKCDPIQVDIEDPIDRDDLDDPDDQIDLDGPVETADLVDQVYSIKSKQYPSFPELSLKTNLVKPTIIQSSQPYLKEAPIQRVSSKNEKGASIPYRPTISCRRSINDPDPDNRIEWALQEGRQAALKRQRAYYFENRCGLCPFVATHKKLNHHERSAHPEFSYKCDECDYRDVCSSYVNIHRKSQHNAQETLPNSDLKIDKDLPLDTPVDSDTPGLDIRLGYIPGIQVETSPTAAATAEKATLLFQDPPSKAEIDDNSSPLKLMSKKTQNLGLTVMKACGVCEGCLAPDCGACQNCKYLLKSLKFGRYSSNTKCSERKCVNMQVQHHKSPGEIETSTSTITSSTTECTKTVASPSKKTAVRERWMTVQRKTNNSTVLKYSSHDSVPVSSVTTTVQSATNSTSAPIVKLNRSSDSISKGTSSLNVRQIRGVKAFSNVKTVPILQLDKSSTKTVLANFTKIKSKSTTAVPIMKILGTGSVQLGTGSVQHGAGTSAQLGAVTNVQLDSAYRELALASGGDTTKPKENQPTLKIRSDILSISQLSPMPAKLNAEDPSQLSHNIEPEVRAISADVPASSKKKIFLGSRNVVKMPCSKCDYLAASKEDWKLHWKREHMLGKQKILADSRDDVAQPSNNTADLSNSISESSNDIAEPSDDIAELSNDTADLSSTEDISEKISKNEQSTKIAIPRLAHKERPRPYETRRKRWQERQLRKAKKSTQSTQRVIQPMRVNVIRPKAIQSKAIQLNGEEVSNQINEQDMTPSTSLVKTKQSSLDGQAVYPLLDPLAETKSAQLEKSLSSFRPRVNLERILPMPKGITMPGVMNPLKKDKDSLKFVQSQANYQCSQCDLTHTSFVGSKEHERDAHGKEILICHFATEGANKTEYCEYATEDGIHQLRTHYRWRHKNYHPCYRCEYLAMSMEDFKHHTEGVHSKKSPCPYCKFIGKSPADLIAHQGRVHSNFFPKREPRPKGPSNIPCSKKCGYVASSTEDWQDHWQSEHKGQLAVINPGKKRQPPVSSDEDEEEGEEQDIVRMEFEEYLLEKEKWGRKGHAKKKMKKQSESENESEQESDNNSGNRSRSERRSLRSKPSPPLTEPGPSHAAKLANKSKDEKVGGRKKSAPIKGVSNSEAKSKNCEKRKTKLDIRAVPDEDTEHNQTSARRKSSRVKLEK